MTPLREDVGAAPLDRSELLASRRLTPQEKGLGKLSLSADLERAEILEPESLRRLGLRLSPQLELVEIVDRDLPVAESVEQMISKGGW